MKLKLAAADVIMVPLKDSYVQGWLFENVGDLITDLDQRCNGIPLN